MKAPALVLVLGLLASCAPEAYVRPSIPADPPHSKIIERPLASVWDVAIPVLGKRFFVDILDKSSGFIGLTYQGDTGAYVDCGRYRPAAMMHSTRSVTTPNRPAEAPPPARDSLATAYMSLSLEGRVNLIFESLAPNRTRVTASESYSLTRQGADGKETISLTPGKTASFSADESEIAMECIPTGKLVAEVLNLIE